MLLNKVCHIAENQFRKVSPHKSNSQVIWDTIYIEKLSTFVVDRLETMERLDQPYWWKDKELVCTFDKLFTSGVILLPLDPVERVRWIALICVAISIYKGFSFGNVLVSLDYLPDEELDEYDFYGQDVVDGVRKFREDVAENGWKSLLV